MLMRLSNCGPLRYTAHIALYDIVHKTNQNCYESDEKIGIIGFY
jgi:hypothetical protein